MNNRKSLIKKITTEYVKKDTFHATILLFEILSVSLLREINHYSIAE